MKKLSLLIFLLSVQVLSAQIGLNFNIQRLSSANDYNQGPRSYNDVWGYVGEDGTEYAVLGGRDATIIYDISDPTTPNEVANIPGARSIWRDAKSFGDYIYVVTDQGNDGLLIIDMSKAPDTITHEFYKPIITAGFDTQALGRCHNLYIDEKGIIFISGCNMNNGGILMFDASETPESPVYLGPATNIYSHDNYARGDTIYTADLNIGSFRVIDVRNKTAPVVLASQRTTRTFSHNTWLSDDGDYLFTTDERAGAFVDAYDISDLGNIQLIDTYQPLLTAGEGVVPHNVHYFDGYLVISYYADGLKVVDATRPHNLIEVGGYDTNQATGSGDGCWGAFPFLPSGRVLASDMDNGLFVLDVDYKRACYLEGLVRDAVTGNPLGSVEVEIMSRQINEARTGAAGTFATGQVIPGTFQVTFSRSGYESQTIPVSLTNGELTEVVVDLQPLGLASISGSVINSIDRQGLAGSIRVENEGGLFEISANANGSFDLSNIPEGTYDLYAGLWGFRQKVINDLVISGNQSIEIELDPGFEDDFVLDLGWNRTSTATTGDWVREVPIASFLGNIPSNPGNDIEGDLGTLAYVTGNGGFETGDRDIDDGVVSLISPIMDLSNLENPVLSYWRWFLQGGASTLDDQLTISISNGDTTVTLEVVTENTDGWEQTEFILSDFIEITDNMQLIVETGDLGVQHIVEAGFDGFKVENRVTTNIEDVLSQQAKMQVFPNPFQGAINVSYQVNGDLGSVFLSVLNLYGQELQRQSLGDQIGTLQLGNELPAGTYFIRLFHPNKGQIVKKVVKQ